MGFLGISIAENKLGRMAYLALLGSPISYLLFYHMQVWSLFQWMQRGGVKSQKFGVGTWHIYYCWTKKGKMKWWYPESILQLKQ